MSDSAKEMRRQSEAQEVTPQGRRYVSTVWTLLAILVVIAVLAGLFYRFSKNATSTVNPQKTQPANN